MKRDATGKFISSWNLETKKRVSVTLTSTAWRLLEEEAQRQGISRSEVIERVARSFKRMTQQLSEATETTDDGLEHLPSNGLSSLPYSEESSQEVRRTGHEAQLQSLICKQEQAIATLQHQKQELEALLEEERQRTCPPSVQANDSRVSTALAHMSDGLVAFDHDGHCTYINPAAARIFHKTPAELHGKPVWDEAFPEAIARAVHQQLHQTAAVPTSWREDEFRQSGLEMSAYPSEEGVAIHFRDVSKRKQAEEALQSTNERLGLALAAAKLGDWSWEAATDRMTLSERAADLFGIAPGSHLTWTQINDLLHEDDREQARVAVEEAIANHGDYSIEYRVLHRGGAESWVAMNGHAHYAPTGEIIGMVGVVQNITEHKQLAAELQAQQEQFKTLAENAPDIIARFDPEFRHLYVSPSVERATGLPAAAFIGKTHAELGMPEERCIIWRSSLEQVFATGQEQTIEFQFPTPHGMRWYQSRLVPEFAEDGSIASVLCVARDFDDYKQTEQALRQSEERLRFALEAAGMVAWDWNPATGQVVRSHTAGQILGLDSGTASEDDSAFLNLIHPDDRDTVMRLLDRAIAERSTYYAEFRIIKPDGSLRWICDRGRVICGPTGNMLRMSGVTQDITERKHVESALRESELKFRTLADTMPQLFWITRPDGYHEYFNRRWFEYTGMTLEETQGWGWNHLLHPEDRQRALEIWQESLRTGDDYTIEYRFQRASDGEYRWFLGRAFPLRDSEGQIIRWFGSCTDIHDQQCLLEERDRALAQEQAARKQAEAANRIKDEFLAVLSHELRTPLNPILGWARLLKQGKIDAHKIPTALETIERNAKQQTQLIDDLLDISRILQGKLSLNSVPVDFKTIITDAIETVRLAAEAKTIQIQVWFPSEATSVLGDAARLQQAVWNLLSNAVKFTPNGGRIEVKLEQVHDDTVATWMNTDVDALSTPSSLYSFPTAALTSTEARCDHPSTFSYAQITVTDTGKGIRPEFLPHVFDTFRQADSTITRTFGGLGLGLAIARHVVELHGGFIQADSPGEGQGATFTIRLPLLSSQTSLDQEVAPASQSLALEGVRVLAVDDEPDNLDLVTFILEQAGAFVVSATSAQEALHCFHQGKSDILLADIGMPHMDGYTLLRQIRSAETERGDRSIPAIALTAYASEAEQRQALAAGFQRHIPKPIESEVLLQAILKLVHPEQNSPDYA